MNFASVLVEAMEHYLDYRIPPELQQHVKPGMCVKVPVRSTVKNGIVFEVKDTSKITKTQPILEVSEQFLISFDLLELAKWMSHYYCCPLGKILKTMFSSIFHKKVKPKEQLFIQSELSQSELKAYCETYRSSFPKHVEVLDILLKHPKGILLSELMEKR